jgi:hypothetical protein
LKGKLLWVIDMSKKGVILFLMLQIIKKFSFSGKKKLKGKDRKNALWAERQIREMAKLGGKLVL